MLIVMKQDATPEQIQGVARAIEARGFKAHAIPGAQRTAIGVTGNQGAVDRPVFESLPGVLEVIPVTHGYKLVSREVKPEDTVVEVGDVRVGGRELVIVAGPYHDPDTALSDGPQSITPGMFAALMGELRQIAPVIGREL